MHEHDDQDVLPEQLAFSGEHLSELALTALADGQGEILPPRATSHLQRCAACQQALGGEAERSVTVQRAFEAEHQLEATRPRLPALALAAALALALLGALPGLQGFSGDVALAWQRAVTSLPVVTRALPTLLRATDTAAVTLASSIAAVFLLVLGFWVASRASRHRLSPTENGESHA